MGLVYSMELYGVLTGHSYIDVCVIGRCGNMELQEPSRRASFLHGDLMVFCFIPHLSGEGVVI